MKILVTGGAGYKGVKLVAKLLSKGYDVTLLDNFMYGFEPILHLVENKKLTVLKQDIRNKIDKISRYDVIFHLAGLSGFPACSANPASAQLINVDATKSLSDSLSKDQLIIYASTTSFYGKSGKACNEQTPIDPVSHYGRTKYMAEKILAEKDNYISLRFATVFGFSPKMRMDLMVNDFAFKALKEGVVVLFDGYAKRTFIHIDDAVDAYIFAMENRDKMKGEVFNVGGDHLNFSKLEIAQAIQKHIDFKIIDSDVKDKDVRHFIVCYEKIKKMGFIPQKSLDDGIKELLRIFKFYEYYLHYKII
ncbi:MAG: NAD(P)-dependent oxidoreductase [Candidatus Omnitrophica bacterium]|nr:NAD(P)-dependent oxidoreductase [Candidatus Omnitrophota bacterium]